MDPLIGQTIDGRYYVESHIGEGGMGAVYKARHIAMAQAVAIKVLLTDQAEDPATVERFIREARSSFQIDHPNCVRVTDFNAMPDGTLYMVMEYLNGRTVADEIAVDGPMDGARVRHVAAQTAEALHHAHGLGLVHRDLKPGNIMLLQRNGDWDFVKVFDFGLAKLFDNGASLTGLTMSPLTQTGIVFGTPEYMSPEQAIGAPLDPQSDVYTLGVCCYELLTGQVPFESETFTVILSRHVKEQPVAPSQLRPDLEIDPALEALVLSCLQKDPRLRPTAPELAAALRQVPAAKSDRRPSSSLVSSETLDLSQAGPGLAALRQPDDDSPSSLGFTDYRRQQRKPLFYVVGGLALVGALATLVVLATGSGDSVAGPDSELPSEPSAKAVAAAVVTSRALDAGVKPTSAISDAAPTAVQPFWDAGPPPDGLGAQIKPSDTRPTKHRTNAHLEAAEDAYQKIKARTGNRETLLLKQLSQASAALKQIPKSRRAAFLAGDALLKSGDKVRACSFFRRSSKKLWRAKGCSD